MPRIINPSKKLIDDISCQIDRIGFDAVVEAMRKARDNEYFHRASATADWLFEPDRFAQFVSGKYDDYTKPQYTQASNTPLTLDEQCKKYGYESMDAVMEHLEEVQKKICKGDKQ